MAHVGLRRVVERLRRGIARGDTDGDLLDRYVAHRDEAAFAALVDRHGPKVYAVCRRVLGQHQLAEDAYQAVFVVLARKAHAVRPRSAVGGFLYGVARKAALEAFAVSRRRKESLVGRVPEPPPRAAEAVEPDVLAMLDEEIANLSDAYRAAVVLCELDGVGRADAARQLGIAEGTLSSRLAAARKQLAARLTARGVTFSLGLFAALSAAATAAPPLSTSATASAIAGGVMRSFMLAKLKVVTTAGVLVAAFAAWSLGPTATPTAAAAAPTVEKDEGLIWTHNIRTRELKAYAPDGTEVKAVKLPEGVPFFGLSADGTKMAFGGKNGKGAKNGPGLTLHVGDIATACEGADTGVGCEWNDRFVFSPDRTRVVRVRNVPAGRGAFQNTLFDLMPKAEREPLLRDFVQALEKATEKARKAGEVPPPAADDDKSLFLLTYINREYDLLLPADHEIRQWAADGKSWRVSQFPNNRWLTAPVAHLPKLTPVCAAALLDSLDPSPDGKTFLARGYLHADADPWFKAILRIDRATGTAREVKRDEPHVYVGVRWSPDGNRMACVKSLRDAAGKGFNDTQVLLLDADGQNEKVIVSLPDDGQKTRLLGWFPTKKPAAPAKPKTGGVIWTYDSHSGKLVGYAPDGTRAKDFTLTDGRRFLGLTPDGSRILYAAEGKAGLTLHLRPLGDGDAGTDLGIPFKPDVDTHRFAFSRDGTKLLRSRGVPGKARPWPNAHAVIDLKTKQETVIDGLDNCEMIGLSLDGKWALALESPAIDPKAKKGGPPQLCRLFRAPLDGDEPKPLVERPTIKYAAISPDGKTVLFTGTADGVKVGQEFAREAVHALDVATGKVAQLADHPMQSDTEVCWSPDGSRLAYLWLNVKPLPNFPNSLVADEAKLVACDADGKNPTAWAVHDYVKEEKGYTQLLGWFPEPQEKPKHPIAAPPPKAKPEDGRLVLSFFDADPIKVLKPDGTVDRTIQPPGKTLGPWNIRVSPSGRQIAFLQVDAGGTGALKKWGRASVRVLRLDDKDHSAKTLLDEVYSPRMAWTADEKLVVSHIDPAKFEEADTVGQFLTFKSWTIDPATGEKKAFPLPDDQMILDISADGKNLLSSTFGVGKLAQAVYRATAKDMKPELIREAVEWANFWPRFSPSGKHVLAVGSFLNPKDEAAGTKLHVYDWEGKTEKRVDLAKGVADGRIDPWLDWSPDGRRIAFVWKEEIPRPKKPRREQVPPLDGSPVKWYGTRVTVCDADGTSPETILRSDDDDAVMGFAWGRVREPKEEKPKAERPAKADTEADKLIPLLGDKDFQTRQAAEKQLRETGPAALAALKGGRRSDDPEVARRSEKLVEQVVKDDAEKFAKAFLADTTFAGSFDHPIWARWAKIAGDDRGSRELFAEVLGVEGAAATLGRLADGPTDAEKVYPAEIDRLRSRMRPRAPIDDGHRRAMSVCASLGEAAYAVYLGSFAGAASRKPDAGTSMGDFDDPEGELYEASRRTYHLDRGPWQAKETFSAQRANRVLFRPLRKVTAAALMNLKNPQVIGATFRSTGGFQDIVGDLSVCLPLARMTCREAAFPVAVRAASWLYLAEAGEAAYLPDIARDQAAAAVVQLFGRSDEPGRQYKTLAADVSIAAQLILHGKRPTDFGFLGHLNYVDKPVDRSCFAYGFADDATRKAAHEKALAFLKTAPPPKARPVGVPTTALAAAVGTLGTVWR